MTLLWRMARGFQPGKVLSGVVALGLALSLLTMSAGTTPAYAEQRPPAMVADFDSDCLPASDWRVSAGLAEAVRAERIRCVDRADGGRALAVTVQPGDAYDPNPGATPTERAEFQLRRELIRFDATTWYSFRFRTGESWPAQRNRTVIHQIKQNIDLRYEKGRGGEEICDPANPLFKIEVDAGPDGPVFRAKTAGTPACGDSVGQMRICGDWRVTPNDWHRVHVAIRPASAGQESRLRLWLDGRACPAFTGVLGYPRYGTRREGRPVIDTQPRFGLYRDALPDIAQTILFDDIAFWTEDPGDHPVWQGLARQAGE